MQHVLEAQPRDTPDSRKESSVPGTSLAVGLQGVEKDCMKRPRINPSLQSQGRGGRSWKGRGEGPRKSEEGELGKKRSPCSGQTSK